MSKSLKIMLLAALVTAPAGLQAQDKKDIRSLKSCRGIADNAARLACYDQFTDGIGRDVVTENANRPYDPVKDFGASRAMMKQEDIGEQEPEFIEAKIVSAELTGYSKWTLTLDSGAVWTQIDSVDLPVSPKAGATVKIKQAALGSYMANVGKGRGFKVKRVR